MTGEPRLRALIVDDEPLARKRLRDLLAAEPAVEIGGEAGSGTEAVKMIRAKRPDLVFLDIQMPGTDGFGVVREIAGDDPPLIIFVTAHDEHAIKAFEVEAVDYVLKPVLQPRLREAVRRAVERIRGGLRDTSSDLARLLERLSQPAAPQPGGGRFPIRREGSVTFVRMDDIDWLEADGDYVRIHAGKATHVVRETITEALSKLPSGRFVRVHRSIVVNTERIREVQPWFKGDYVLILNDGTKLRSGRTYRSAVQALID
jgi:two-component system, LytTR family, response regulator